MEIPVGLIGGAVGAFIGGSEYLVNGLKLDEEQRRAFEFYTGSSVEHGHLYNTAIWIIVGMGIGGLVDMVNSIARTF